MTDRGDRRGVLIGAAVALAGLVVGVVAAAVKPALPLPVTADLRGLGGAAVGGRAVLGEVAGRIAMLVPAALAVAALLPTRAWRPRLQRSLPVVAAAPIAVFLVAQLNGVRDVGALVLVYAATAAAVLMRSVPGRGPFSIAAMLGIVPWGVIALHQVGALLTGGDVPVAVRTVTIVVLAASIAEFVRGARDPSTLRAAPMLVVLAPALLAAGSLAL